MPFSTTAEPFVKVVRRNTRRPVLGVTGLCLAGSIAGLIMQPIRNWLFTIDGEPATKLGEEDR